VVTARNYGGRDTNPLGREKKREESEKRKEGHGMELPGQPSNECSQKRSDGSWGSEDLRRQAR